MTDVMITDGMKQQVITRLATINSAIALLSLTNGKPAQVTVDEVFDIAVRIERWAWRDLLGEQPDARAPDRPAAPAPPAKTAPAPPAGTPAGPQEKAAPQGDPPRPNGHAQRGSEASEKQIAAIFAIGKSKGYTSDDLKALVKEKLGKSVPALTSREASKLIDDLHAL